MRLSDLLHPYPGRQHVAHPAGRIVRSHPVRHPVLLPLLPRDLQ